MVIIILAVALLVALTGLGIEIGVASWNIRRANKYKGRELNADYTAARAVVRQQSLEKQLKSLDDYASKISWLLNFLYNRYGKFVDIEMEVRDGLIGVTEGTPIGEAEAKYKDLKKALKIIWVTVKASERMGNLMNSITDQLNQIIEDFQDEEEEKVKSPEPSESDKPTEGKDERVLDPRNEVET
jgi:hypothetical protein